MSHPADGRQFGCRPSPPDRRDYPARAFLPQAAAEFPDIYGLPFPQPVQDQGTTSMCVAFGVASLKATQEQFERGLQVMMSPGYVYANRADTDWQGEGMYPREALAQLVKFGVPPRDVLPVTGTVGECMAALAVDRTVIDQAARPQRVASYVLCQSPADVQGALYHLHTPVLLGATITKWFAYLTGSDGMLPAESAEHFEDGSPYQLGGHAMIIVGWRQIDGGLHWVVQNSWGESWGDGGRCYMPADWPGILELWAVTDTRPQGRRVRFEIGQTVATLHWPQPDGGSLTESMTLDVPAQIIDGRLVLPARAQAWAISRLMRPGEPWPGDLIPLPITDADGRVLAVEIVISEPEV